TTSATRSGAPSSSGWPRAGWARSTSTGWRRTCSPASDPAVRRCLRHPVAYDRAVGRGRRVGQGGNVVSWLLLGLVVLAAGVYGALCLVARDKVPAGTTVDGVAIGGLRPAAAAAQLGAPA